MIYDAKDETGDIKTDWKHESDGKGIIRHGGWYGKDGETSSTHHDSKRVKTRLLAEDEVSQQELDKRTKCDILEPSKPPNNHPKRPTEPVNPPHH
jgi:hypothetical protein